MLMEMLDQARYNIRGWATEIKLWWRDHYDPAPRTIVDQIKESWQ